MKKNAFWTFLFSFVPGCGLMYLGYLKKGLQYMLMFGAAFWLVFVSEYSHSLRYVISSWLTPLSVILMAVIWFFQIFDAMHTRARMNRLEIDSPADDGFFYPQNLFSNTPLKKISAAKSFAVALIVLGSVLILSLLMDMAQKYLIEELRFYADRVNQYLFPVLISLALVIAGIRLLRGSKKNNNGYDNGRDEQ